MTVVDATAIVGAVAALAGVYWTLRKAQKEGNVADGASWRGLNQAIVADRDHWKAESDRKDVEIKRQDVEIEQQDAAHAAELAVLREKHQAENAEWAKKLAECQEKVRSIGYELYQLQKLLPPNLRPGPDNAPDR